MLGRFVIALWLVLAETASAQSLTLSTEEIEAASRSIVSQKRVYRLRFTWQRLEFADRDSPLSAGVPTGESCRGNVFFDCESRRYLVEGVWLRGCRDGSDPWLVTREAWSFDGSRYSGWSQSWPSATPEVALTIDQEDVETPRGAISAIDSDGSAGSAWALCRAAGIPYCPPHVGGSPEGVPETLASLFAGGQADATLEWTSLDAGQWRIVLETPSLDERRTLLVDPAKDCLLVREEHSGTDGSMYFVLKVLPQQLSTGQWLPQMILLKNHVDRLGEQITIEEGSLLSASDEASFQVAFPIGATVDDYLARKSFLVTADGMEEIHRRHDFAHRHEILPTASILKSDPVASVWRSRLIWMNLPLLLAILLYVAVRRLTAKTRNGGR